MVCKGYMLFRKVKGIFTDFMVVASNNDSIVSYNALSLLLSFCRKVLAILHKRNDLPFKEELDVFIYQSPRSLMLHVQEHLPHRRLLLSYL